MKLQILSTVTVFLAVSIQQVHLQFAYKETCFTADDAALNPKPTDRSNLYSGQQAFTVALLDAINKATPNENIFFSPHSTFHALLLAFFGAKNDTESQLKRALNLNWADSKVPVSQAYRFEKKMRERRSMTSQIKFASADKIYVSRETELRPCMKDLFVDELETIDFAGEPDNARLHINQWVEDYTRGNIKDILIPGSITQQTKLVLANAAYFKGQWASQFNKSDTRQEIFYETDGKMSFVNMMYKEGNFNYALNERLGAHILELPYLGETAEMSMFIFLPPFTPDGLDNLLSRLTAEALQQALNEGMSRKIEVKLPVFTFEKTIALRPILEKIGIGNLFESTSNLTQFSERTKLTLDDAVHKAKIEVNEEGSTAAAATVLFSFRSSRPLDPAQFFCNHPFMFLIYDNVSHAVLFAGIYRGPDN